MGVELHLVGLLRIGPENEGSAVGELEVSDLQFGPLAADDRPIFPTSRTGTASPGKNARGTNGRGLHPLFKTAAETPTAIAADPKHLGARIGLTTVLHTWGSALTHHSHVHVIVPGGGLSPNGARWIACKPGGFLLVRVLSRLFRRLFSRRPRRAQPSRPPRLLRRSRAPCR
jgi:hypothetical protein